MYADAAGGLRLWPRCLSIDGSLYMNSLCTFIRYTWIWRSLAWVEALFSMSISVLFSFVSLPRVEMPWQSGNVDVHRLLLSSILLSNVARQRRIRFRLRVCSPSFIYTVFWLIHFLWCWYFWLCDLFCRWRWWRVFFVVCRRSASIIQFINMKYFSDAEVNCILHRRQWVCWSSFVWVALQWRLWMNLQNGSIGWGLIKSSDNTKEELSCNFFVLAMNSFS